MGYVGWVFQTKEKANIKAIRWTFAFIFKELKENYAVGAERMGKK